MMHSDVQALYLHQTIGTWDQRPRTLIHNALLCIIASVAGWQQRAQSDTRVCVCVLLV